MKKNETDLNSFHEYLLTHFMLLASLYTPGKHQKAKGFLMFLGGLERGQLYEMD